MRLPKTVNRSNDGFQEVSRCRGDGRGGGYGRGDMPGRGSPGRRGRGGRGALKEKGDETMENEGKVDAESEGTRRERPELWVQQGKAKERMRERGEQYVESFTQYSTHIKIKFKVKSGMTFNVRSSLIKTLNVMKKCDPTLAIVSTHSKIYEKYLELPSGKKFTDEITVTEYHPPRAASKITCYVALKSKVKFNEIKYANAVMEVLKKNQIYLRVDNYNNSPVSIPGFLIKLHPSLIRIATLKEDLYDLIKDLLIDNNSEILQHWMEADENNYDSENNAKGNHPAPYFRLTSGKRNFGGVSTNVILVECAKEDTLFVKYVFTKIYQNPKFDKRGHFVPSGIHLIEDPKLHTALLKKQNQYLNNLAGVTVYGLPFDMLESQIKVEGYEGSPGGYIHHAAPEIIESMEVTGQTSENGKWFVLCIKTSLSAVQKFFDYNIKEIFINQIPSTEKLTEYPHPTLGKEYAAVLQGIVSNPQEDTEEETDTNTRAPPLKPNKRQHITLSYVDTDSFPPLPAKQPQVDQSQHNKSAKHNNTQEQTAKTAPPALSEFSKKIAAMNNRLQGQMDTMKKEQDSQMGEMLKSFESCFNDMQECMDALHKDLRSLIITMQQTMHNMMEKNNTMENATGTTRGTSVSSENINTPSDAGSKRDDKLSTLHAVATD
eukprot:scaffold9391_cov59-Attheya_sp.AAC.1